MTTAFANRSVLVIEDESFTRMVLAKMLGGLGFRKVHQAGDGGAGLAAVREHAPDVVLCDVEMKPMDGLAFLRALREGGDESGRALPVVFMTNRLDEVRIAEARTLGADTFLLKPVTPDALRRTLGERLG